MFAVILRIFLLLGYGGALHAQSIQGWGDNSKQQLNNPPGFYRFIAAGDSHALGVKTDGTVAAWGSNSQGQASVPPGLNNVAAVAAGVTHSLALKRDGTVVGWGSSASGEIAIPTGLKNVIAVAAGQNFSLALKSDGTMTAWGDDSAGAVSGAFGQSNVKAIAAGGTFGLALRANGTVAVWGSLAAPVAPLSNVKAIAAGANHALALLANGTVVAWGDNTFGQASVPPGLVNVAAVAAGASHSVALKADGTVMVWGLNIGVIPPAVVGVTDVVAGNGYSIAIIGQSIAVTWGGSLNSSYLSAPRVALKAIAAGTGSFGFGLKTDGTVIAWGSASPPSGLNNVISLSAGLGGSLALKADGTVVALGPVSPVPPALANVVAIAASGVNAAILADGTLVEWGQSGLGQLNIPSGLANVKAVATGGDQTMVLKSDGTVAAWGVTSSLPPGIQNIIAVSVNSMHDLLLRGDGTVLALSANYHGEGIVPSGLNNVAVVSAGFTSSLAVRGDGTVITWGSNNEGTQNSPAGLTGVWSITSPYTQAFALVADPTTTVINNTSWLPASFTVSGGAACAPGTYAGATALYWPTGASCSLSFASPQDFGSPATRYAFANWVDGALPDNPRNFAPPLLQTTYYGILNAIQYQVLISVSPAGAGSVTPPSGTFYNANTPPTLTATPNTGYVFDHWTGPVQSPTSATTSLFGGPAAVTAVFQFVPVTIDSTPGTFYKVDGSSYSGPSVFRWMPGTTHTLDADALQLSSLATGTQEAFQSWSDGGARTHTITAPTVATSYFATFQPRYQLTVRDNFGGTYRYDNTFHDAGSVVNLAPSPSSGYVFASWSGTGNGSYTGNVGNSTVTMNGPIQETASYALAAPVNYSISNFVDSQGVYWTPWFFGGQPYSTTSRIFGTSSEYLYRTERFGDSAGLQFARQLPNGTYNIRFKYAEIYFQQAGQRLFNVNVNGTALTNFDIAAEAGASNTAVDRVVQATVTSEWLFINYNAVLSNPKVGAVTISPAQVDLTLAPTVAVLSGGQQKQFTARVVGTGNTAVNWTLTPQVGSIDSTGLYTAPAVIAARQTITVTATSQADPTKSATSYIKLGFPWQSQDIGAVNAPGGFSSMTEAYTLTGAGDLNGNADAFRFAWQPLSGDGSIVARVNTVFSGLPVKAGVMIRDSLQPGAPYAMMSIYGGIVGLLQSRGSAGAATNVQFGAAGVYWVRLDRQGSTFTGYLSNDGVAWQMVSSVTAGIGSQALVGLAVSSGFGAPYTVVFDNIEITGGTRVSVDQSIATMAPGQQAQFTATVTGNANTGVTWAISPPNQGSITAAGVYTAPASLAFSPATVTITATSTADPAQSGSAVVQLGAPRPILVNAGGPTHIDPNGTLWQGDTGATAGTTYSNGTPIPNTTTPYLYQSEHFHTGTFSYQYVVPNGNYSVRLMFAEIYPPFTTAGQRVFHVSINGNRVLTNFDIVAQAGGQFRAVDRTFPVTVNGGLITITFEQVTSAPQVNGIAINPQ